MKELTTAQGKLRCGECEGVFNAMDSLSTKLPNHEDPSEKVSFDSLNKKQQINYTASNRKPVQDTVTLRESEGTTKSSNTKKKVLAALLMITLLSALAVQIWLSRDIWFSQLRQPDKIQLSSKKVFSHPSQPGTLIITASIKSLTKDSQPFPYLEARLLDASNKTIALRRFRPHEYLEKYQSGELLKGNTETAIKLKIEDPPGNRAKHFQFSFK